MSAAPYIQQLKPVAHADAQGAQKEILDTALKQVGFIPNMYANMVNAPAVLSTYLHGYGLFRKESGLTPTEQEVVFLAVSRTNGCKYCTAAHSMIADKMSGVPAPVLQAIRSHQPIPDPKLAALFEVTTEMVKGLGQPSPAAVKAFLDAGYQERDLLYIVLAVSVKVLSNYSNHAFGTAVDERFAAYKVD
ncbi:MAG: carboxymuconolactone decarboxylase family protein [Hydrogenophaga sp.]|uniref:carboxymuconolactone decarboxylase family protein n=1 Tax=Hydrogenophaga sp. TaxID=1904254 RepID=UPI003D0991BD